MHHDLIGHIPQDIDENGDFQILERQTPMVALEAYQTIARDVGKVQETVHAMELGVPLTDLGDTRVGGWAVVLPGLDIQLLENLGRYRVDVGGMDTMRHEKCLDWSGHGFESEKDLMSFVPFLSRTHTTMGKRTLKHTRGGDRAADTKLLQAIESQTVEDMKAALARGANPNFANPADENKTISEYVLDVRDRAVRLEMMKHLIKAGLSLTTKSKFSENTPLINAVTFGRDPELVQLLIGAGSKVDATGSEDGTALYWAADNNDIPMITLLLKNGADPERAEQYMDVIGPVKAKLDLVKEVPLLPGIGVEYQTARDRFEGKTGGKSFKFPRRFTRKHCMGKPCKRMGFTEKASCRPYKNCYRK